MSAAANLRIDADDSILMVVDIQQNLMPKIHEHERVLDQASKLIRGAKILGVPIMWTEQYKKGLGESCRAIVESVGDAAEPMEKLAFGGLDDEAVRERVASLGRNTLILCGIEAHICVLQTALRALEDGRRVALAVDAVSSRRQTDADAGIARLTQAGAMPATVESLFMEWLRAAGTDKFRQILPLLKD